MGSMIATALRVLFDDGKHAIALCHKVGGLLSNGVPTLMEERDAVDPTAPSMFWYQVAFSSRADAIEFESAMRDLASMASEGEA